MARKSTNPSEINFKNLKEGMAIRCKSHPLKDTFNGVAVFDCITRWGAYEFTVKNNVYFCRGEPIEVCGELYYELIPNNYECKPKYLMATTF